MDSLLVDPQVGEIARRILEAGAEPDPGPYCFRTRLFSLPDLIEACLLPR
jgi:hypothetical protein